MKGFIAGLVIGTAITGTVVFAESPAPELNWMIVSDQQGFKRQVNVGAQETFVLMPTKDALFLGLDGRYTSVRWQDLEGFGYQTRRTK